MSVAGNISSLLSELPAGVELVAVTKTHSVETLRQAYDAGCRIFGENRPQEMCAKAALLPKDIQWHQIGHLQRNKVRSIMPFAAMIQSGDSERLLNTVNSEAARIDRMIDLLLEIHIADEESKFGWSESKLCEYLETGAYRELKNIRFRGVMGMATYTDNEEQIRREFKCLASLHSVLREKFFDDTFDIISMGMTSDYRLAVECGSTMVRAGSGIFESL